MDLLFCECFVCASKHTAPALLAERRMTRAASSSSTSSTRLHPRQGAHAGAGADLSEAVLMNGRAGELVRKRREEDMWHRHRPS